MVIDLPIKMTVDVKAQCDICGREIALREPEFSCSLNTRTERPITYAFGSNLAVYDVRVYVTHTETCFVVEETKILCADCHKQYRIQISNIELETNKRKRSVIDQLKISNKQ